MEKITYSLELIDHAVTLLIEKMKKYKIFTFHGDMGSGKTTLIRALFEHIGTNHAVTSPTFAYVNTYTLGRYKTVAHHFDLYRLSSIDEFYALALDDLLFDTEAYIFIEWPDLVLPTIQKNRNVCQIFLHYEDDFEQRIMIIKESKINAAF